MSRDRPRRRVLIGISAAAVLVVAASVFLIARAEDAPDVEPRAGPSTSTTTDSALLYPGRLDVFPPEGAIPSEPETGVLVADLPPVPVFVYEDRRVIFPLWIDGLEGGWKNWFERRLTPEGLELVKAEIRRGGRLDAVPPGFPPWGWFDGDRELITGPDDPDLSWLPPTAWEDTEPKLFVPSKYLACLRPSPLALLPRDAAEPFAGAVESSPACLDLALDDAREVATALDAAGAGQPGHGNPFSYGIVAPERPALRVEVLFSTYLPHGNAVFCCAG